MTPAISILMAVYNGQNYLLEAVNSILQQDYIDFEFIIVNDASSDSTAQILAALDDPRIIIIENPSNIGLTRSLNRGLQVAKGKYIARQDADDISLPGRLAAQVAHLEENPQAALVSCNLEIIDAEGRVTGILKRALDPLLVRWNMHFYNHIGGHSQVIFRRETAAEVGNYTDTYRYSQDYDLWLRLMQKGDLAILPEVYAQWRTHEKNISNQQKPEQERISIELSQQAIADLIGETIQPEEVNHLRKFIMNPGDLQPTMSHHAAEIHQRLRQCYAAFSKKYTLTDNQKQLLRHHIGEHFAHWTRAISIRSHPRTKIKIASFIARWSAATLLEALPEKP